MLLPLYSFKLNVQAVFGSNLLKLFKIIITLWWKVIASYDNMESIYLAGPWFWKLRKNIYSCDENCDLVSLVSDEDFCH